MKRQKVITRIFRLFKKAEVEEDLVKDIKELIEERIESPEPKKEEEEPRDKIQTLADELLDQMKRV